MDDQVTRQTELDRGYDALGLESWQQAEEIFDGLLQQDPHCGLSLLGKALAVRKLPGRQALAKNWEKLRTDPAFQKDLQPAEPDFLRWLQTDMEGTKEKPASKGPSLAEKYAVLSGSSKLLVILSAVQLILFLLVYSMLWLSNPVYQDIILMLFANLFLTVLFCGCPMILGPLYGRSIVKAGRFRRLLKVLNNLTAILGLAISAIMVAACYTSLAGAASPLREDIYFFLAFAASFLLHLTALIFPIILERVST